ncbi:MAG: o-succinylbenzoate synthase [Bacteroidetes bacterium GWF2_42_66]|nr:MAG: o-succinylbenzoate synthase [Bacteroidetes bacterium GWA2_42_15]OFY01780.1 MAG: o-succinylbenzoate synthase [Bacteroidetes bacterium GWE2_42_39]OFY44927.1 MAG: o-succinylbenzoate synthase [Bacteroidetes bacterium GWF2_42_66]HBL76057.1 o-succinylbenzoate synthase [Prolixibacteraceae bacterium]HCR89683.1 o-succinylbenzoate synthase [Prolixibacteraceae bacterium]
MKARFKKYTLQFHRPAGTSRGTYNTRDSWFIFLEENGKTGIGECAPLPGLSLENPEEMNGKLIQVCEDIEFFSKNIQELIEWPSIQFGLETAFFDLKNGGRRILFPSDFTEGKRGIPINGLIWMGNPEYMQQQIREKLEQGFRCIKLKIGAIDFETELALLKNIRKEFSAKEIILRVDANGAFKPEEALEKLKQLAELEIHSIEQPVAARQWNEMARLCKQSPLPIALDEELIGITEKQQKKEILAQIKPAFLVLKPSLHGGISGCNEWITQAENAGVKWWITSYLESNVGLNAITQWAATKPIEMEQGLGTGKLFANNFDSPLTIVNDRLWHFLSKNWKINLD